MAKQLEKLKTTLPSVCPVPVPEIWGHATTGTRSRDRRPDRVERWPSIRRKDQRREAEGSPTDGHHGQRHFGSWANSLADRSRVLAGELCQALGICALPRPEALRD